MNFALNTLKFEDIRSQIIEYLKANSEYSAQFDFTASNIAFIIDTMTYICMNMAYQVSNVPNNLLLDTTVIRKNAVSIAKTMGYRPKRTFSAKSFGTIQYVDTSFNNGIGFDDTHSITIPVNSVFLSDKGLPFMNLTAITLTKKSDFVLSADTILTEGSFKTFSYLGTGIPFQKFTIPSTKIEENNFALYVRLNTESQGTKWDEVKQSFNLLNKDSYFLEEDIETEGYINVLFGNGEVTNYPANNEVVDIRYLESNGSNGNNCTIISLPTNITLNNINPIDFNTTNFTAPSLTMGMSYGGKSYESIEDIKNNAPKSFAAVGRAVTQNDYKTLLTQYPYIYKTNTIGGDLLYPGDHEKLGNIYISSIPVETNIFDLFNNDKLYLNVAEELALLFELNKYRIISTQINFIKPSYVHVDITPHVETGIDITQNELIIMANSVSSVLNDFIQTNYNDYNIAFRSSKFNGEINKVQNVISSDIECDYSFALTKESFYDIGVNSAVYLPVKVKTRDTNGNVTEYDNFVRTNAEEIIVTGKDTLLPSESTIYGKINHEYIDRYMYNVDNQDGKTCDVKIDGSNLFLSFYRFTNDTSTITYQKPQLGAGQDITIQYTTDPTSGDAYKITAGAIELGTFRRTMNKNQGFKGLIESSAQIVGTTNGDFYQSIASFNVSGIVLDTNTLEPNDYIMYSQDAGSWIKCEYQGLMSAQDSVNLITQIDDHALATVINTGNFGGLLPTVVTDGDLIIFNPNSSINQTYFWEQVYNIPTSFNANFSLPKEVKYCDIKRVINLGIYSTDFNGKYNNAGSGGNLVDNDLIFYNSTAASSEPNKWTFLGNVGVSSINTDFPLTVNAAPSAGCSLDAINYNYSVTGIPVGYKLRTVNIGNFGLDTQSYVKVNWPTVQEIAFDNDILVYTGMVSGSPTWNIWQESAPEIFNIDGNIETALPIKLTYGDMYSVANSGNFNGDVDFTVLNGDQIIYVDNDEWIFKYAPLFANAATSAGFPTQAVQGWYFQISQDGNFENSYMISPSGTNFVQGDFIIFNGTDYVYLNEYTFDYNPDVGNNQSAKDYLNTIDYNSVYYYTYDNLTNFYKLYFNDIFNGQTIGTFRYKATSNSTSELYNVGKLEFETYVNGDKDISNPTFDVEVKSLFDNTVNQIRFLPKYKLSSNGSYTTDTEVNFDTTFNIVVTIGQEEMVNDL